MQANGTALMYRVFTDNSSTFPHILVASFSSLQCIFNEMFLSSRALSVCFFSSRLCFFSFALLSHLYAQYLFSLSPPSLRLSFLPPFFFFFEQLAFHSIFFHCFFFSLSPRDPISLSLPLSLPLFRFSLFSFLNSCGTLRGRGRRERGEGG